MLSELPVVTVHIPPALRHYTAGHDEVTASGETVGEVFAAIGHEYPDFRRCLIRQDGTLRSGLAIYLGPKSIRELQGLATPINLEELVSIVPTGELEACSAAELG